MSLTRSTYCIRVGWAFLVLSIACQGGPPERAEGVRSAILRANVIGKSPLEVARRMETLRFKDDWHLWVGPFQSDRLVLPAQLQDARGRGGEDWTVRVIVTFDSTRRAVGVEAHNSAVNPL
jgi:hypothetical protein